MSTSHKNCCKNQQRPKKLSQFIALCFPPNPTGHSDINNRIHNPDWGKVKKYIPDSWLKGEGKNRKGWWFVLDPKKEVHLLDGSGDGRSRGIVVSSLGVQVKKSLNPTPLLICFNACSLKSLAPRPGEKPVLCSFTWSVGVADPNNPQKTRSRFAGWIPISAIKPNKKNGDTLVPHVRNTLKHWRCCAEQYQEWGSLFTKGAAVPHKLRNVDSLRDELTKIANGDVSIKKYFKEVIPGHILNVIKKYSTGDQDARLELGILSHCHTGNRLTDYLPKGLDFKDLDPTNPNHEVGYTNLSANLSVGDKAPRMAPIALDMFPAGHTFNRLRFKGDKRVYGFVYSIPPNDGGAGKKLGRVEWYYGYCDVVAEDKKRLQRRYGWVPALAVH